MTIFMENPLSNDHTDEYLLESADPRWNQPATLHSVKTSATRLDSRIDWVFFTLDNKIDRKFAELDNKIEVRFRNVERNARINYFISGIIALCSLIGAFGVFVK
jgi:hypothetical protein